MKSRLLCTELQMQYAQLILPGNCPEGIYLSAFENLDKWEGVIFVRRGYYQGCILGFSISFPQNYPFQVPLVHFDKASIVHPLVNPSDDRLSLSFGFPSWDPHSDNVTRLLYFIKGIFKTYTLDKLNEGLVSNSEAWRLYQFNRPVFAKLAAQCATVSSSSTTLYGRTSVAHANGDQEVEVKKKRGIPFRELNETEVQTIRESIFGVGE